MHGCYWHQHEGCRLAYSDRQYSDKWKAKFETNKARDIAVLNALVGSGWRVAVLWECATRDDMVFAETIAELINWIEISEAMIFESQYKKE